MSEDYEADFDYEAAEGAGGGSGGGGTLPAYLSRGGTHDSPSRAVDAADKARSPARARFSDDDGGRGRAAGSADAYSGGARVMAAPISSGGGAGTGDGRGGGGSGLRAGQPVVLAKREPSSKAHRGSSGSKAPTGRPAGSGPARMVAGNGVAAVRGRQPASGGAIGASGGGASGGGHVLGSGNEMAARLAASAGAPPASTPVKSPAPASKVYSPSEAGSPGRGGGGGRAAGTRVGSLHDDLAAVVRERDKIRVEAEKSVHDLREAMGALRERYEGMLGGKDKALKAAVRKAEALQAAVDDLRAQMTAAFQTDRMADLENAK
jgi:hypothetical protein